MFKQAIRAIVAFAVSAAAAHVHAADVECDKTGKKYQQMIKEGTPLSEKDTACWRAFVSSQPAPKIPSVTTAPAPSWRDLGAAKTAETPKAKQAVAESVDQMFANARPVGDGLWVTDKNGCVHAVLPAAAGLRLMPILDDARKPVCRK